jgi:NADPH-dependent 2,4-dienoyl-CoA reductase/sulfur reductase-like enzyme
MKIIIVGGVAGGATAAARLRRLNEDAEIILFERGEYISYANCGLPYYIGGVIDERENILLQTPESFYGRYRVDVRIKNEVIDIDRDSSQAVIKDLKSGKEYRESYDKILLAPGSKVMVPPVEGISGDKVFTLRGVNDSEKIKDYISEKHPRHALVVGGGYIGLEVAENLRNLGIRVTILEMAGQLVSPLDFEMAAEVHQHLKLKNIEFFLGEQLVALNDEGKSIRAVFKSGVELDTDMAVVSIGIKPEVELARKAGLALGDLNGIKVDKYLRTSDPDIYAAGDAIEAWDPIFKETRPIPLAGPANKQARIAADNIIMGNNSVYKGSVGTAIAKVFDIGVGVTGFSETYLKKKDIEYSTVLIHSASHAGYYPESLPVSVKLNFSLKDGRVLGGQAIGKYLYGLIKGYFLFVG